MREDLPVEILRQPVEELTQKNQNYWPA